jgi:hypothetical protein
MFTANDGEPFTASFGTNGDPLGLNSTNPWDFPNRLGGPGCLSLVNPGNPNNYIKTQCFTVPSAPNMAFWTAHCDPTPFTDANGNPVSVPYPQCFNLRGNSGRNILTGPGLENLDFSLFKITASSRIRKLQGAVSGEDFQYLESAQFRGTADSRRTQTFLIRRGAPTGVAGLLTSKTTTSRQIQFALKLIW